MLSQFTLKQTRNKVVGLVSIVLLATVALATPIAPAQANTPGVQCAAGNPEISIPVTNPRGITFTNSGVSGKYRLEVVGSQAWGNHPDSSKARYHGSSFFVIKNQPAMFGPDTNPVTASLGGQRVSNATIGFGSLFLDPPYNQSRKRVAAAALGIDETIDLNTGDYLTFVVNAVHAIRPTQQGSYALNTGTVIVRICLAEATVVATPTPTPGTATQCSDGLDNDGDGAIDMNDFSCSNAQDNDETNPKSQCQDSVDNDGDGKIDSSDPGCHTDGDAEDGDNTFNAQDNSEDTDKKNENQCSDESDNEGDGFEDKADPDCYNSDGNYDPTNEEDTDNSHNQCVDKKDNEGDKLIDFSDPDCHTDNDATDGDDTFDPTRKEDKKQGQVAAIKQPVQVVAIQQVPVTAKTGATLPLMSVITLAGGATTFALKRYFI